MTVHRRFRSVPWQVTAAKGLRGLPLSVNPTVHVEAPAVKFQADRWPEREVPDKGGFGVSVMRCVVSSRVFNIRSWLVF